LRRGALRGHRATPDRPTPTRRDSHRQGEDRVKHWKPADNGEKWFCDDCGSSIFGRKPNHPDSIGIRMGTFDRDAGIRPSVRALSPTRHVEDVPDDGLPRHLQSRHNTP
jgi:hypothetical protein